MRVGASFVGAAAVLALGLSTWTAGAAPVLRVQVTQKGDIALIGNTLGHDCAAGTPMPVVGTPGPCGANLTDSAPDVFWRSDSPMMGQAEANTAITVAEARSTAVLTIPPGATITHAFIYWSARRQNGGPDTTITLDGPAGTIGTIAADVTYTATANTGNFYQAGAHVTSLIQAAGEGPYRVSGVTANDIVGFNDSLNYAAWWMVVFYQLNTDPPRNLALFEGLDPVSGGNPQNTMISGFLVPNAGFDAKLNVVTFEGDGTITGDQLFFNGGAALTDASNPANNFFNGSRTFLGAPVSVMGDLPQLTGGPGSMSGVDIDVVDVTAKLAAGQTSATIQATSTQDVYLLGGWATSISTYVPDFSTSTKAAVDLNGGGLVAGDTIEYTVVVTNTGNDASINTVLTDALPAGVTYVPGTLQITQGANMGAKTDMTGDDQGEYDGPSRTLTVRLGAGANAVNGGTMAIGESATLTFRVTVDAGASGIISNQAVINAGGALGAPASDTPTDGNGGGAGSPPTDVIVNACATDADCNAPIPHCDVSQMPTVCVECFLNSHCPGTQPTCDLANNTCVCIASGPEVCDGIDNDCDGTVDPGCLDTDGDGIPDDQEVLVGTDPNDADSDDDGVPDGMEPDYSVDSDGDGLINALDPDSDNDGLFDGTEMGLGCGNPDTDVAAGTCTPDGDGGATVTDPLDPDTDDGGVGDGAEDKNLNGAIDAGETDPTAGHGADDPNNLDSDGDGLSDGTETTLGTDPNDADSDDDGVIDGLEPNPGVDSDGDGIINALDPDSDNDGLFDGTEMGFDCSNADTDAGAGNCIPDGDAGETLTSPIDPDTDDGGVSDGSEDINLNGVVDAGETDPTAGHGADDSLNVDSDGDGLSDGIEGTLGTDPNDADSDDDGVPDGQEPNPGADSDGDGVINALDPDSDNDGLFDGTEMGLGCGNPDTDGSAGTCIPDGDNGATTTSPVDPDTDDGGVSDGDEDTNHDGVVDPGERDPNDPADDNNTPGCFDDSDCGDPQSGVICGDDGVCVDGCRGQDGNGCPEGQVCSSTDSSPGTCSDGAGGAGGEEANPESVFAEGGSCVCATGPGRERDEGPAGLLAGITLAALLGLRRRRRQQQ